MIFPFLPLPPVQPIQPFRSQRCVAAANPFPLVWPSIPPAVLCACRRIAAALPADRYGTPRGRGRRRANGGSLIRQGRQRGQGRQKGQEGQNGIATSGTSRSVTARRIACSSI